MNPEDIPLIKLSVNPEEMETPMDRISNIWATSLAGTVADTISSSALLDPDSFQILKGGWNESLVPRWYLLKNNQFKHMTEVGLRGSLDGKNKPDMISFFFFLFVLERSGTFQVFFWA